MNTISHIFRAKLCSFCFPAPLRSIFRVIPCPSPYPSLRVPWAPQSRIINRDSHIFKAKLCLFSFFAPRRANFKVDRSTSPPPINWPTKNNLSVYRFFVTRNCHWCAKTIESSSRIRMSISIIFFAGRQTKITFQCTVSCDSKSPLMCQNDREQQ